MSKLGLVLKKNIARRFIAMMLVFLSLILAGAFFVLWKNYSTFHHFTTSVEHSKQKQELITQIADHTNQIFFRARGYYAFLNSYEYNELFHEKKKLEDSLASLKELSLNQSEIELVESVERFKDNYFTNVFPVGAQYAKDGDYASLRKLSSGGVNQEINGLISYATRYQEESEEALYQELRPLFKDLAQQGIWFIVYILMVLVVSIWVTTRTTRDIVTPLKRLSQEADHFAKGETVELKDLDRIDEIGLLSRSLDFMIRQIQVKEEVLIAQNEELQAQQDELMMQQEELQEALLKMEENEGYLEKRNRLIQSLSNTLDKQELLTSIIRNMVEVMDADKGIIILLNAERDFSSFGVSERGVAQLIGSLDHGPFIRISETKSPYVVLRENCVDERGYHEEHSTTSDLYLPVMNANNELVAYIILSRVGRTITSLEQQTATGLAKQISLSLDKLAMYEETAKQRQMTQDMLNTIQEGVQLLDLLGNTLQVNRPFCDLIGYENHGINLDTPELLRFFAHLRDKVNDPERLIQYLKAIIQDDGETTNGSHVFEMAGSRRKYIQVYAVPLYRNQEKLGTLLVYRDITKEYEIDKMKSEFVSTVSHELRTPLASVLGFAELLLHKELKPERQQRYMTAIHQEAKRLTSLINDFLDLQRMESGRQTYEIEQVEIDRLVREVFSLYSVQSPLHSFHLDLQTGKTKILGDKDKLRQVIMNLVSNAVKYSPNGGKVIVVCRDEQDRLLLTIQDEGLGIPPDSLPHLFTKFYRVDNSDRREIGGTGLGLAIVQEIVKMHHGEIAVTSESGNGSTFTVMLPISGEQRSATNHPAEADSLPARGAAVGHVMIIEDDLNLTELLRDELTGSGFAVYTFSEGAKAVAAMKQLQPDAIVLDLVLKDGENGWDVIERMQQDPALRGIPIVISSAFEEKKKAFELGAKGYLIKPYHPDTLSKAILLAITSNEAAGQILIPAQMKE